MNTWGPARHTASSIHNTKDWAMYSENTQTGKWVPSRPLDVPTLIDRIKLAYNVFIGKYDALDWEDR